jgi:oligopeptide/dipeptide ABC transporter ATP-binding protein
VSLLEVAGLTIAYAGAPAVDNLSFSLNPGESLGIAGESGSGKTQTALGIMGLLPANAHAQGRVLFDGADLLGKPQDVLNRFRARRMAMVFQDPKMALNPYLQVGEQLTRVLREHRVARGKDAPMRAIEMLRRVRLPDPERRYRAWPHQLSGGMRQRVMIALALACEPELLIADEPTTALDVTVQAQVLALLQEIRARTGIALLLITHDLGVIAENCERMLVMHHGRGVEQGLTAEVFAHPTEQVTKAMLAAARRLDDAPPRSVANSSVPVLSVDSIRVTFRDARWAWHGHMSHGAVRAVSFTVGPGETLAVVGESGCGKTTLARVIAGLVRADSGTVHLCGKPLAADARSRPADERRRVQMVFQDPVASLDPAMKVTAIAGEPVALHEPGLGRAACRDRIVAMLARVGLDASLLQRFPHELSGGQAQRVAIARALLLDPKVLICDEAVAALDGTARISILDLLQNEQQRSGLSLVFITHDLAVVRRISHRILVMYMGRVCEVSGNDTLFRRPRHPYTRALINSMPIADPARGPRPVQLSGEVTLRGIPSGCPFHPRCEYAVARCAEETPEPRTIDGVDVACHRAEELDLR